MNHAYGSTRAAVAGTWLVAGAIALTAFATLIFLLSPTEGGAMPAKRSVVSTAKTSLGTVLVDSQGRTLYLFQKDPKGKSTCSGQCATFWPPLITTGKPIAAAGARASLIGMTMRADGRMQVTYNHHPLYTFAKDKKRGQTSGEGVSAFGAEWYVVSTAGSKIDNDDDSSGGGGGYGS